MNDHWPLMSISSIMLTMRGSSNTKKQDITRQMSRNSRNGLKIVKVKIGEGIDVI